MLLNQSQQSAADKPKEEALTKLKAKDIGLPCGWGWVRNFCGFAFFWLVSDLMTCHSPFWSNLWKLGRTPEENAQELRKANKKDMKAQNAADTMSHGESQALVLEQCVLWNAFCTSTWYYVTLVNWSLEIPRTLSIFLCLCFCLVPSLCFRWLLLMALRARLLRCQQNLAWCLERSVLPGQGCGIQRCIMV